MQDAKLILRASVAFNQIVWPGPTIVAVAAAAALTNAAYDSGTAPYFALPNSNRIPFAGMFMAVHVAGPITSTGAAGTSSTIPTVTFADVSTGPAVGYTHILAPFTVTYVGSVGSITNLNSAGLVVGGSNATLFWRLPETRHGFIRVQLATTLGTITGCSFGPVGIAFQFEVDTEGTNVIDLG